MAPIGKPFTLTVGPFIGMCDVPALSAQDATRAAYLENCYSPQAPVGGDLISRPGYTRIPFTRTISSFVAFGHYTLTGSITLTNGSAAVSATGGAFTTELFAGMYMVDAAGTGAIHQILSITDDNTLTLTAVWDGVTNTLSNRIAHTSSGGAATTIFVSVADSVQVGDLVTSTSGSGGTGIVITRTDSTHFDTNTDWNAATAQGHQTTTTVNAAGIVGGPIYGLWQHTRTDATYHRFLIVKTTSTKVDGTGVGRYRFLDGSNRLRLVEYDPSASILTLTDRTSVSMNSVALTAATRIYAQTFANYFIITDGTNRPRKIDASSAPYTLTNLTDGNYATYGSPWVYYGKFFFLDNSDRVTIRWSEENDPDTGYGTGTSDNSWTLRQTSPDQIEQGVGTNSAMYILRQNSITTVTGAANSDFKSAGTLDDVSTTIGTRSPDSVCVVNQSVFFIDQYGRPGRIEPGYGYLPLYDRCIETIRGVPTTAALLKTVWARYDGALNIVKAGYPAGSSSTRDEQMLVFDSRTWECMGLHKIPDGSGNTIGHDFATNFLDQNIFPRFTVASGQTSDVAFYVEQMETTQQASSQDTTAASTTLTVAAQVTTPKIGGDPMIEKRFFRLIAGQRNIGGTNGLAALKATARGPNGTGYSTAAAMTAPGGSYDGCTTKAERGIDVTGRWAQFQITNDTTGNPQTRFTLDTITVGGNTVDDHPSAR